MKIYSTFSKDIGLLKQLNFGRKLVGGSIKCSMNRAFGFPMVLPKIVRLIITNMCDSRCKTCNIWEYYHTHPKKLKEEITTEEIKKFIDQNDFMDEIMLTGGQVTMRNDIVELWQYLDKKGFRTGGPTNAVNLNRVKKIQEDVLSELSGNNVHAVYVSIDGIDEMHDNIRGIKGDYGKSFKLLNWLLEKQKEYKFLRVGVSHNITPSNFRELPKFLKYFLDLGVEPHHLSFRVADESFYTKSWSLDEVKSSLTKENRSELTKILKKVAKSHQVYDDWFTKGEIQYLNNPSKMKMACNALFYIIQVDPYCNVFACYNIKDSMGNLRDYDFSLKEMYKENDYSDLKKIIKDRSCPNCWNRCYAGYSKLASPKDIIKLGLDNMYKKIKR